MAENNPKTAPAETSPENPETEQEATDQIADEGQEATPGEQPPSPEGQGAEGGEREAKADLGTFKSEAELKKAYDELRSHTTRVSQELANTRRLVETIRGEQVNLQRQNSQAAADPVDWRDPDKAWDTHFQRKIPSVVPVIIQQVEQAWAAKQLQAVRAENPDEFDRLVPLMAEIANQHQELNAHPRGAEKLFEMAQKEATKRQAVSDPDKMAELLLPRIAKRLGITVEDAKKAMADEANQRKALGGLGGGKSVGPPKKLDATEELVLQMEKYR